MAASCGLDGERAAAEGPSCGLPAPSLPPGRPPSRLSAWFGGLGGILFAVDVRSLAAFRIGLALLLLCDLWFRAGSMSAFYTDGGVLPRAEQPDADSNDPWHISLHLASGALWWQIVLFASAAVAAGMLLVGWRTRLAAVISWVLLISLHARNPQVLQGGDVLLRCLLFWGMFLPLGAVFSVDRARELLPPSAPPRPPWRFASVASAALLLQVCVVYWFSALLKTSADWHDDATAVFYALSIDQLATRFGHWLLNFPHVLAAMTRATIVQEAFGPCLAFIPGLLIGLASLRLAESVTAWCRLLLVVLFVGFHLGLAATMELGPFPYICWVAWLPFLPALFWDGMERLRPRRDHVAMWYDGDCGFCKALVRLIETFWLIPATSSRTCQEDPEIHQEMLANESWVVVGADGVHRFRFDALLFVMAHSPWLSWLARVLRWRPLFALGTRCYRWIAGNRSRAARLVFFMTPRSPTARPRAQMLADALCAFLLAYVVLWNVRTLHANSDFATWSDRWFPTSENWILAIPRLDQYWSMFSPCPLRDDGWYIAAATLKDGSQIDLVTGKPPDDAKPALISVRYTTERWRKYLMNLYSSDFTRWRKNYARWLSQCWNESHPEPARQVEALDLYFWKKTNRFGAEPTMSKDLLVHYP